MKQILKELGFEELPTLSEFVIAVGITHVDSPINEQDIYDYNDFIRQPITKGMFVPCDEEGNVLDHIECSADCVYLESPCQCNLEKLKKLKQYQQAKERVLFEGWEITVDVHEEWWGEDKQGNCIKSYNHKTIEQAINNGIKLILK